MKDDLIQFRVAKKTKKYFANLAKKNKSNITEELTKYMEYQIKKHGKK